MHSTFNDLKIKYGEKIDKLKKEMSDNGFHTILNLKQAYSSYIHALNDLFHEYDYIVPYDMYEYFYKISCQRYNFLFSLSNYCQRSGNLPGAFLKEAISDLELWSIPTLSWMEKANDYPECSSKEYLSAKLYDAILKTESDCLPLMGYALDFIKVSDDYVCAARQILEFLGSKDKYKRKAYQYYKAALTILKDHSASASFDSNIYYTYYIALNKVLVSYKNSIEKYNVKCDFDIDKKIFECNLENYRQAQAHTRDKMIVQVNNLIKAKKHAQARKIAKEIIDICEEREKNIKVKGVKLSLKNAYELLLSIPELSSKDADDTSRKLKKLTSKMSHDDFYCMDGGREYPRHPF